MKMFITIMWLPTNRENNLIYINPQKNHPIPRVVFSLLHFRESVLKRNQ